LHPGEVTNHVVLAQLIDENLFAGSFESIQTQSVSVNGGFALAGRFGFQEIFSDGVGDQNAVACALRRVIDKIVQ
jgi:hypothetical protein